LTGGACPVIELFVLVGSIRLFICTTNYWSADSELVEIDHGVISLRFELVDVTNDGDC
jgi:hypothetical protein